MNILEKLYYYINRAVLKSSLSDIPEMISPIFISGLLSSNIIILNAFLAKNDIVPFYFLNKEYGVFFAIALMSLSFFYFNKNKRAKIIEYNDLVQAKKYNFESILVIVYVLLSFILIFVVAFYKPDKL